MTVRVRFAPSPTGNLHIGGARTALFTWMYAQKHNGSFILRIEDTDQSRYKEGSLENIYASLKWLGLQWDEGPDIGGDYGPYTQSERLDLYQKWADWLLENGKAFRCYCSAERLAEVRKAGVHGYDGNCRDLSAAEIAAHENTRTPSVLRFRMPKEGATVVKDLIRGDITFQNAELDDRVLLKSDGFPTYHLANVIDDHLMEISHVIRADEWISTAPLHSQLYDAFGWQMPEIAHLPVILSPTGKGKLSKRDQAFQDGNDFVLVQVSEYPENGFISDAVVNFLANVGWAYGDDVEIFDITSALPRFDLPDVNPAPSRLPFSKLEWLNGEYIQVMDDELLAKALKPFLEKNGWEVNVDSLLSIVPAMKPRLKRLTDAAEFLAFLFDDESWDPDPERFVHKKMDASASLSAFQKAYAYLETADLVLAALSSTLSQIGEAHTENEKAGPFLGTMRYAITGQKVSPPLFESVMALGKERTLRRLEHVIAVLEARQP